VATPLAPGKRLAEKLLGTLPKLDPRRRELYRGQFSNQQCWAWGDRTWSANVLADAERTIGRANVLLTNHTVPGYPLARLAWLCELTVELKRAIAEDDLPELRVRLGETRALARRATTLRTKAVNRIKAVLMGNRPALADLARGRIDKPTPQRWPGVLRVLAHRARTLIDDDATSLLAEDSAVNAELITSLEALADELDALVPTTWRGAVTNDSTVTSHLEGRVLRELAFACDRVRAARAEGVAVGSLPLPPSVRAASRRR